MLNKTLVHFDEVSIGSEKEFENIKAYTNPFIAIEGKGRDTRTFALHANIILTNNVADSLQGVNERDDRQFSVPVLTNTMLPNVEPYNGGSQFIERLWKDDTAVEQLARYLWHRPVKFDRVSRNLKTPHYYEIIKQSKTEWNRFVLEDVAGKYPGKAIHFHVLTDAIKLYEGFRVGRGKLEALCRDYPETVQYRYVKRTWTMFFAGEGESKEQFHNRIDALRDSGWENVEPIDRINMKEIE